MLVFDEQGELVSDVESDEDESAGAKALEVPKARKPRKGYMAVKTVTYGKDIMAAQKAARDLVKDMAHMDQSAVAIIAAIWVASNPTGGSAGRAADGAIGEGLSFDIIITAVEKCICSLDTVRKHTTTIGVSPDAPLQAWVYQSAANMMTLFSTLAELGILLPKDPVPNKELLPFRIYNVTNLDLWVRLLSAACGVGRVPSCTVNEMVFNTKSSMYEILNLLGFGPSKNRDITEKEYDRGDKKESILSRRQFLYDEKKALKNKDRWTSTRTSADTCKRGYYPKDQTYEQFRRKLWKEDHDAGIAQARLYAEMTEEEQAASRAAQETPQALKKRRLDLAHLRKGLIVARKDGVQLAGACTPAAAAAEAVMSQDERRLVQHQYVQALAGMLTRLEHTPVGGHNGVPMPPAGAPAAAVFAGPGQKGVPPPPLP